ncbi:hypothetical protein BDW66DRAFT_97535 [Aspergillus desertorum]
MRSAQKSENLKICAAHQESFPSLYSPFLFSFVSYLLQDPTPAMPTRYFSFISVSSLDFLFPIPMGSRRRAIHDHWNRAVLLLIDTTTVDNDAAFESTLLASACLQFAALALTTTYLHRTLLFHPCCFSSHACQTCKKILTLTVPFLFCNHGERSPWPHNILTIMI